MSVENDSPRPIPWFRERIKQKLENATKTLREKRSAKLLNDISPDALPSYATRLFEKRLQQLITLNDAASIEPLLGFMKDYPLAGAYRLVEQLNI